MQSRRAGPGRNVIPHLPTIAPRDELASSPVQSTSIPQSGTLSAPENVRTRLPPRSRTGCWTCRTRKVKCDESRPTCGQCARLQHECDYNPRLSFRDDTPRVIERMQEVLAEGSTVWNPQSHRHEPRNYSSDDTLPSFNALTTDEDREKKAEAHEPGTYHVIVNPDSFLALPEYSDSESPPKSELRRPSLAHSLLSTSQDGELDRAMASTHIDDPNVVILDKFEDCVRRIPPQSQSTFPKSPTSSTGSLKELSLKTNFVDEAADLSATASPLEIAKRGGLDARLLEYYRRVISPKLAHVFPPGFSSQSSRSEDPFEQEANSFSPLYHAMMALSALSIAYREGAQNIDALQHYQQALPLLQLTVKSESDASSDGALFTHFFLLLYEIATAEQWSSNLWNQHLDHLRRIILSRTSAVQQRSHMRIMWLVCVVDTYALLSASSSGEFAKTVIGRGLLPVSTEAPNILVDNVPSTGESEACVAILMLHQDILKLASRLGQLAHEFRDGIYSDTSMFSVGSVDVTDWQQRVTEVQTALRHIWATEVPSFIPSGWLHHPPNLPPRVMALFEHAFALHRACIIYSHTSMWSGQRLQTLPDLDDEIGRCCQEILQLSSSAVESNRLELRFIAFPLFISGFASSNSSEKMLALELMQILEQQSIGRNTRTIRKLLQAVYDRQKGSLMSIGHALGVDWIDIMRERGLAVVNFGL